MCFCPQELVPVRGCVLPIAETPQAYLLLCNVENLAMKLGSPLATFCQNSLCQSHILLLDIICLVPACFGHRPGSWRSDAIRAQYKMTVLSLQAALV